MAVASSLSAPVLSGLVQPLSPFGSFTRVHIHSVLALLAAHSAAPVELALALGDAGDARGVVPPPAAHHLAAVCPTGHLVAHPAGRAQGAWGRKRQQVRVFSIVFQHFPAHPPSEVTGETGHLRLWWGPWVRLLQWGNPIVPVTACAAVGSPKAALWSLHLLCFMGVGCCEPGQGCSFGVSAHDGRFE